MKIKLLLIAFLFQSFYSLGQKSPFDLEKNNNEYLEYLCKTWGYLKYFHSEVSVCLSDWDDTLIETIPLVMNAENETEFNEVLLDMINGAGAMEIASSNPPNVSEELSFNLYNYWFDDDPVLSEEIKEALIEIRENFRPHSICHVGEAWAGGNPTFDTDDAYYENSPFYPVLEQRLLALFRYWNIIRFFSPYNDILDEDWNDVLGQFIPRIVDAQTILDYHLAFKELTVKLDDAHSFYISQPYSEWVGFYHAPFLVKNINGQLVITEVIENFSEPKPGDIIKKIDGVDINERRAELWKYAHGGNEAVKNRNLHPLLLWGDVGSFDLEIENENGIQTISSFRSQSYYNFLIDQVEDVPVTWDTISPAGCHYAYIHMGLFENEDIPAFFNQYSNADGIVFDVRNYPNGTLWTLVNYLFPNPVPIASFTVPSIEYPGTLSWHDVSIGSGTNTPYEGEVIILFDEDTQSQAEYTVMGLEQHPNATKIGSTTAAADGNVTQIYLPGQIRTYFTGLGTFYQDQSPTQRIGIIPDIEFIPTVEGIRDGKDEMLEYALNLCQMVSNENIGDRENLLTVFPSPVHDVLQIEVKINTSNSVLQLFDLQGKKLTEQRLNDNATINWEMESYPAGTYFVRLVSNEGTYSRKIIKQ